MCESTFASTCACACGKYACGGFYVEVNVTWEGEKEEKDGYTGTVCDIV